MAARFTLVVRPDGQALLTSVAELSQREREAVLEAVGRWDAKQYPVLIVANCDVVQIAELELELDRVEASA